MVCFKDAITQTKLNSILTTYIDSYLKHIMTIKLFRINCNKNLEFCDHFFDHFLM